MKRHRSKRLSKVCYLTALVPGLCATAYAQDLSVLEKPATLFPESARHYGPFDVLFSLRGDVLYDDNIYIRPQKTSDLLWSAAPKISVAAGDYREREENLLTFDYSPRFILFTDHDDNNAIEHEAFLNAQWRPGPWKFRLRQGFGSYAGAVVDVGNRTDRKIYSTDLSAVYDFSPKTSLEAGASQNINDYDRLLSNNEWVARAWADYEFSPILKLGAGIRAGWQDIEGSENQTYQQGLIRASYVLSELVSVRASAGIEIREAQGHNDTKTEGVFTFGATYRALENTSFTLEAYRRPQTSVVLKNQNYVATGFSAGIHHVLFDNYGLDLNAGYENNNYNSVVPGGAATRKDNYFFVQPGVNWRVRKNLTLGAYYFYRKNDSTVDNYTFNNNQVGFNFNWQF